MSQVENNFSKKYNNYLAPEAIIWIEGDKLTAKGIYYSSLEVDKRLDDADSFSISISDAISIEFEEKHEKLFSLGNKVEIYIGYADSGEELNGSLLFIGFITNVSWNFTEDNFLDITVEGEDYSFLLMKHSYKKPILEATISTIVKKLCTEVYKNVFKKIDIEDTNVIYPQTENEEKSDYLFIKSLAEKIGYEFYVDKETLLFKSPPQEQESSFTLYYGQDILSFKPELNVMKKVSKVRVVGLAFSESNEVIVAEATSEVIDNKNEEDIFKTESGIKKFLQILDAVEYEVRESVQNQEAANKRAKAILENFSKNYFKAEIKSIGIPELKPGITISLKGLGERFNRDYYIEKTVHSISDQGYETTMSVRGSSNSFKKLDKKD